MQKVPITLLASRSVFRQHWNKLRKDTTTEKLQALVSRSLSPQDKEDIRHTMKSSRAGPKEVVCRLVTILLKKGNHLWFESLLQTLIEDDNPRFRNIGREMKDGYASLQGGKKVLRASALNIIHTNRQNQFQHLW